MITIISSLSVLKKGLTNQCRIQRWIIKTKKNQFLSKITGCWCCNGAEECFWTCISSESSHWAHFWSHSGWTCRPNRLRKSDTCSIGRIMKLPEFRKKIFPESVWILKNFCNKIWKSFEIFSEKCVFGKKLSEKIFRWA